MQTISKTLKIFLTALILSNIVLMACVVYFFLNNKQSFTAERIDIKDRSGNNRVVIANTDNIPQPIINGKTYKRAYAPAGMIFYDKNGDERGGLAITDNEETNLNALAFDYQNADAIGILAQDNKHDNYFRAGLLINDKDLSGKPGHNINRINLLTENGNASLVMKDNNEIPRIILKVDSLGNPSIEMLDDKGKVKWKQ
ncbi:MULTISPECIES: hypothetical protein [Sphingobacterium]|uniref:Uncharacterized protein n=1 Tax=Sphingobacterium multivorum TaxID=28454 RepID=A0ABX7CT57_SPHMU|nr:MULTISPECIES: hypothetical protein [Sphingobacterium]QQT28637.1 hypothetical protein I6I99_14830 [Sphingobacterium multivorum]QQT55294.1 hypothetical protein I6I98_08590 [Sphingobacterium multivorum]WET67912.1 MAG: hypothetical protein P0Y57_18900 [Sphingobacterium sp.]